MHCTFVGGEKEALHELSIRLTTCDTSSQQHRSAVECRQRVAPRLLSMSASQLQRTRTVIQAKQQGHFSHEKELTRSSRHRTESLCNRERNRDTDNPKDSPTCKDRAQAERTTTRRDPLKQPTNPAGTKGKQLSFSWAALKY